MITYKTRFTEFLKAVSKVGACQSAMGMLEDINRKHPGLSVGDVFRGLGKTGEYKEEWLPKLIELMGKDLDPEARIRVIKKMKNPSDAKHLLKADFLTEKEHELIKGKSNVDAR